jgi:hypothetical protein
MRTALFWAITQRVVAIPYWRFGTTCRSHLEGSKVLDSWSFIRKSLFFLRVWHLWTSLCIHFYPHHHFPMHQVLQSDVLSTAKQARRWVPTYTQSITFAVDGRQLLLPGGTACARNTLLQANQQNELFCCFNFVHSALLCVVFFNILIIKVEAIAFRGP